MTHKPIVFAHRGANRLAPENTMSAFKKAHQLGAKAIEFDVQLSSDFVPVVMHDHVLERTTNGHGLVAEHTFAELQTFDAGSWFDEKFSAERISSVSEVLEEMLPLGMYVNIELKPNHLSVATLVEKILALLKKMRCSKEQILFSSFYPEALLQLTQQMSLWPKALLLLEPPPEMFKLAHEFNCVSINPSVKILQSQGQAFINSVHQQGFKVFSFTINEPEVAKALVDIGMDGFFTDNESLY